MEVAHDHISIAKAHARGRYLPGDHFRRLIEEVAIMWRAPGVSEDDAHPRTATRATATLGVIIRAWRDISHYDGVQASNVDTHFKRR
jgi:hypothetical protein